ncbi:hypothetical protein HPY28_19270 [Brevibacillus sp. HB1.2]|uniref:hypothetical protein n=1 Tax=Brevibacillus sp. HB1.2 TaxID=2738807 RepID=UPI001575960C|nr:hypothetical protein [Brevibacillus sp. HB1.2]NTU22466.1 hypothetical protein [Brevibacillus sp. HB1.2]
MQEALKEILSARTDTEVLNVLTLIQTKYSFRTKWRAVGDRENNLATINLGSDPAAGLIERVTNAIDAVIDRRWWDLGQPKDVLSPRSAAELWFNIPGGKLSNIDNFKKDGYRDISRQVSVTLYDSLDPNKPTVDIRDLGTGIKAEEFCQSILSLNASRKLKKMFLAGAFGQGGSTALSYSNYTIIVSRSIFDPKIIAATIVRFNPGDIKTDKHGLYEYLVDSKTEYPITFEVEQDYKEFVCGTLVRHVSMDLGKYKSVMTAQTRSLWYLAHHYLFDPVLPFRIENRRSGSEHDNRTVGGNSRLLERNENVEYQNRATLKFRSGKVTINWWLLSGEGDNASNRINQYTTASKPFIITFNGQKQGELPNTIIKNELKLSYLDKYLIVQITCDELDNESRRQLFPSTRESLRDTSILDELKSLVISTLGGDEELHDRNKTRKEKYLKRTDSKALENIRKRLASRVKIHTKVGGEGDSPRVSPPESRKPKNELPPIPVAEPPTLLEILNFAPRKVYAGRGFTIRFRTNANPDYFSSEETFRTVLPSNFGEFKGVTNINNGYGTAYFEINESVQVGEITELSLEVSPKNSKTLSVSIAVEVIPLPQHAGVEGNSVKTPNISMQWVDFGDEYWIDNQWDENSVAQVDRSEDSIDIFVSSGNKHLAGLVNKIVRKRQEGVLDTLKDMYLENICYHAILMNLEDQKEDSGSDEFLAEYEQMREKELQRVAETVSEMLIQMTHAISMEVASTQSED